MLIDIVIVISLYFVISMLRPSVGLSAIILSIPLPLLFYFRGGRFYLCDAILAMTFVAFLFHITIKKKWLQLKGWKIVMALLPFVFMSSLSGILNIKSSIFSWEYLKMLVITLRWMELPIAYLLVCNIVKNKASFKFTLYICLLSATIISLFAMRVHIYNMFMWLASRSSIASFLVDPHFVKTASRLGAERGLGPNVLGTFLNTILPLAIGMIVVTEDKLKKVILTLVSIFLFCALAMTLSRLALGLFIMGILAWVIFVVTIGRISIVAYFRKNRQELIFFVLFIVVCLALITLFSYTLDNFLDRFRVSSLTDAFKYRNILSFKATTAVLISPLRLLMGTGPGNFGIHTVFFVDAAVKFQSVPMEAHNLFLQIIVETGFFGFLAFFCFLAFIISDMWKNIKSQKMYKRNFILASSLGLTFMMALIHHLFDINLWHGIGIQLGINLGLLNVMGTWKE